jgi:hypothetical protein
VGVQIDPARCHHQLACIDHLAADALPSEIGPDRGDPGSDDADIANAIQILARVDHASTADDQIKHGSSLMLGERSPARARVVRSLALSGT